MVRSLLELEEYRDRERYVLEKQSICFENRETFR